MNIVRATMLFSTALASAVAAPALAQTVENPTVPANANSSPNGQATNRDVGGAGDIIVTARRTQERLQDVPISITVFDNKEISDRNIVNPTDLVLYTPSLSTTGAQGPDGTSYALRGFSQANRTAASVAVYFADVVAPRGGPSVDVGDGAGPGQFFDLQNIQVLKGPQGTLFGRNTTGGAILLVPTKPTGKFEGYVEGLYGHDNWKGLSGVVNVPLSDIARFRIAGEYQNRDGYTKNYGIGGDLDNRNYYALRASLVVDLTPDLENYTIVSYSRSQTNGSAPSLTACNRPGPGANPSVPVGNNILFAPVATLACGNASTDQLAQQEALGPHAAASDVDPLSRRTQWGIVNTTTWNASDNITIKNIASYTQLTGDFNQDVFGANLIIPATVPVPILGANGLPVAVVPTPTGPYAGQRIFFVDSLKPAGYHNNADQYTATEELQIQGHTTDNKLVFQGGGYFERSSDLAPIKTVSPQLITCTDPRALQCSNVIGNLTAAVNEGAAEAAFGLPPGSLASQFSALASAVGGVGVRKSTISYRNIGIYSQATYAFTDQLKLTGGVRYTIDRTAGTSSAIQYTFPTPNVPVASCVSGAFLIANNPTCFARHTQKSQKPTWLVDIDYKPTQDILLYAKYARGYRQGSVSPDAADGYYTFKPEKVDSYEGGLKATFRGALPGFIGLSGFYNNLTNQQIAAIFNPKPLSPVSQSDGIVNAGKSRIYGAEVEIALRPIRGLSLNGSYTYLNTKLISLAPIVIPASSPYGSGTPNAVAGQPLNNSPKNKFTISGKYTLPLDEKVGRVAVGAIYSYTSSQLGAVGAGPYQRFPSFATLNLNLDWAKVADTPVDLSLFATNVTDKKYVAIRSGLFESTGIDLTYFGEPRMFGLKVRYNFGA